MSEIIEKLDNISSTIPMYGKVRLFGINIKKIYNFSSVFKEIKKIGEGKYGQVYKYQNMNTGEYVAIKKQGVLSKFKMNNLIKEFNLHREIREIPNLKDSVAEFYDYFVFEIAPEEYNIAIVMELIQGYDLQTYVRLLISENKIIEHKTLISIAVWLLKTVEILHKNNFVHRDIKLANIMMDTKKKKYFLIDFGLSCFFKKSDCENCLEYSLVGTPYYLSPECISLNFHIKTGGNKSELLKASDVWAIGITLYFLATGKKPWGEDIKTKQQLYEQVNDEKYQITLDYPNFYINNTILKILERNHLIRPKINEILYVFLQIGEMLHSQF